MFVLLGAMKEEISEFLVNIENLKEIHEKNFHIYRGVLEGKEVVLSLSGVGKVMAAMTTQYLIDNYKPEGLIFTGLAGALKSEFEIEDLVIAEDLVQHDLDATIFGFQRGQIPYTDYRFFPSDPGWVETAMGFNHPVDGKKVHLGRILTGDQFISASGTAAYAYLKEELQGWAVEMEGAAVAQVCYLNRLPFLVCRVISDKADGKAGINFNEFLPRASQLSVDFVRYFLKSL